MGCFDHSWRVANRNEPEEPEDPTPGWYADTTMPGSLRWWDGEAWTSRRAVSVPGQRERTLSRVAVGAVTLGALASFAMFPFVYGDPGPGEEKAVPSWTTAVWALALCAFALAVICSVASAALRARRLRR
jgi:hypothetical protein